MKKERKVPKWRILAVAVAGALAATAHTGSLGREAQDVVDVLLSVLASPA